MKTFNLIAIATVSLGLAACSQSKVYDEACTYDLAAGTEQCVTTRTVEKEELDKLRKEAGDPSDVVGTAKIGNQDYFVRRDGGLEPVEVESADVASLNLEGMAF